MLRKHATDLTTEQLVREFSLAWRRHEQWRSGGPKWLRLARHMVGLKVNEKQRKLKTSAARESLVSLTGEFAARYEGILSQLLERAAGSRPTSSIRSQFLVSIWIIFQPRVGRLRNPN